MSYFDEQVKDRKKYDDDVFEESFLKLAGAIMGKDPMFSDKNLAKDSKNAIESILHFYGIKNSDIPENIKDVNEQLEYLLRPYGMMMRNVKLSKGWRKDAYGAMLARRTDNGKYIALIPGKIKGYTFYDEKIGKRVAVTGKNEDIVSSEAIAFYVPFPSEEINVSKLIAFIAKTISRYDIIMIGVTALVGVLIGMIIPYLNKILFSYVEESESFGVLSAMAMFMICTSISRIIIMTIKGLFVTSTKIKIEMSVEAAAIMRILSMPTSFFRKYSSGELFSRFNGIKNLCDILVTSVFSVGITGIFSLLYIGEIFSFTPSLAVTAICVIAVTVMVSLISSLWQMKISEERMKIAAKEDGIGFALISGIQKIKLAGAEKRSFAKWAGIYSKEVKLLYDQPLFLKLHGVIITAIGFTGMIFIYYEAARSNVSVSDYYAFNAAYAALHGAFTSLASVFISFAQVKPVLELCEPILNTLPEISEDKQVIERLSGDIELSNVTFSYGEDMPNVIENLSLKISRGEYVAIVGATGCGKSTLLRILLGFEKPQKGAVYYGEKDINKIDLKSLRKKIGVVMQDGKLFQGDIFSNITVSAPSATVEEAWNAVETAGIAEDIRNMPMGMYTVISEGSGGISGGQKQRLMIARAIISKPKILLLDEATSALDNISQKMVADALEKLKCTRVVIAHRLSTIKKCDRIVVIDGGKVAEEGTYEELMEKNEIFAELVSRQKL
ncbi:MAG: ATP-binding cassette domain-containing protein [Firmicutes bacterium]|nr:ATP-binding cassette domain-containing protein [Bacillota bacterium]